MRIKSIRLTLIILCSGISFLHGQQLAFPGAEGYGKYTTGGRGGRVIEVTNLNDLDKSGNPAAGSFRAAVTTSGTDPITIVFRVSGTIKLANVLKVPRPNITIAGQTAPGEGICISQAKLYFTGGNLIIRYVRFRVGDVLKTSYPCVDIENCKNVIVDHCSMSWAVEENMDNYDTKNTTVQWCILSEGLYNSYNSKGNRAYACQWGGQYASYHHNLLANNLKRSPRINGCQHNDTVSLVDFRNNVIYNWSGDANGIYGGEYEQLYPDSAANIRLGAGSFTNFVNNYYKKGPATFSAPYLAAPSYKRDGYAWADYAKWYFNGNFLLGDATVSSDNWSAVDCSRVGVAANIKVATEFTVSPITTQTAEEAYQLVLAGAGATLPKRDTVDSRVVAEVKGDVTHIGGVTYGKNTGIIDSQTEVGGWPVLIPYNPPLDSDHDGMPNSWETSNGLDPNNADDGKIVTNDGYTNLEHYLNSITGPTGKLIKVTSITITGDTIVEPGKTLMQSATVSPDTASYKVITWSVRPQDTSYASINASSGLITSKKAGRIMVTAAAGDGSKIKATKYITIGIKTGIENLDKDNSALLLFPNPATGSISFQSELKVTKLEIFDLSSKLIAVYIMPESNNISINQLSNGIYMMKATFDNGKNAVNKFQKL